MAEDGKIVYKVTIDDSNVDQEAEQAGRKAGEHFGSGAGTMEEVWTGAARRIGEAFVNMALNAARKAGQLLVGSIETGMEFDAAMSQVAATLGYTSAQLNDATTTQAQDFERLENAALEMGRTTAFTATQAAEALNYMALAGYDAQTSIDMLPVVLNLAAAGSMDLGKASDAVTDIQSALGLSLEETIELVDQMARTAQKTNTDVAQLAEGMLTVGGTAQYLKGGTAELAEILGILASNGIKGAEGGTHLRNMLLRLADPTKEGIAMLEEYGIAIFDAQGNMREFSEIMPDISRAMSGLSDEEVLKFFGTVFNVRDIAAANALMNTSTEEWARLNNEIRNSEGAAGAMATTQLDNLKGDITILKSAWEGFQIELANKFEPVLREIMPKLIDLVGRLTESLINADWSKLGDAIVGIAEKAIDFLEYLINHGDEVIRIVETIGATLLAGKVSSLFGGSGAGGVVSGAARGGAKLVSSATSGGGLLSAGASTLLAASPLMAIFGGIGLGLKLGTDSVNEATAKGTLADTAGVAEYEALITGLETDLARLQADRELLVNSGADLTMIDDEINRVRISLNTANENLENLRATLGDNAEMETYGEDAMSAYADGITQGGSAAIAAAAGIAASVASILSGRSIVESAVGGLIFGGLASTITVPVSINGREVARATAYDMSEQMAWEE